MLQKLKNLWRKAKNNPSKVDELFGLGRLEKLYCCNWFNPFLTLWLNFRSLPVKQAWRLPIYVFGRPKLTCLSGKMVIEGRVTTGMVKYNAFYPAAPMSTKQQSALGNTGKITFTGPCIICSGTKIYVAGHLTLSEKCRICEMVTIGCFTSVTIGTGTQITHRCQVYDTHYHSIAYLNEGTIPDIDRPVTIGKYCWVCNTSTINPGTILPDHTIVASNSVVNKDFSSLEPYSLIGGIPAKFLKQGLIRVWDDDITAGITEFYRQHPDEMYRFDPSTDPEYFI